MLTRKDIEAEIATLSSLDRAGNLTREESIGLWMLKNTYRLVKDLPEEVEKETFKKDEIKWSYFTQPNAEVPAAPPATLPVRRPRGVALRADSDQQPQNVRREMTATENIPAPEVQRITESMSEDRYSEFMRTATFIARHPLVVDSFVFNDGAAEGQVILEVEVDAI